MKPSLMYSISWRIPILDQFQIIGILQKKKWKKEKEKLFRTVENENATLTIAHN